MGVSALPPCSRTATHSTKPRTLALREQLFVNQQSLVSEATYTMISHIARSKKVFNSLKCNPSTQSQMPSPKDATSSSRIKYHYEIDRQERQAPCPGKKNANMYLPLTLLPFSFDFWVRLGSSLAPAKHRPRTRFVARLLLLFR